MKVRTCDLDAYVRFEVVVQEPVHVGGGVSIIRAGTTKHSWLASLGVDPAPGAAESW